MMPPEGMNGEMPEMPEGMEGEMPEDMAEMFEEMKESGEMPQPPEGMEGEMPEMPEGMDGGAPGMENGTEGNAEETGLIFAGKDLSEYDSSTYIMLAASLAGAVLAIVFGVVYKRRR